MWNSGDSGLSGTIIEPIFPKETENVKVQRKKRDKIQVPVTPQPPTPHCPAPASLQSTMGSVRSWLVLTVNSQWGWRFLSMRKELRHFLLFKQGPFFFQRTGKATRDSHSASNKPSTPVLGTQEPEWRREKEEIRCCLASFNTCAHLLPGTRWLPDLLDFSPLFPLLT